MFIVDHGFCFAFRIIWLQMCFNVQSTNMLYCSKYKNPILVIVEAALDKAGQHWNRAKYMPPPPLSKYCN